MLAGPRWAKGFGSYARNVEAKVVTEVTAKSWPFHTGRSGVAGRRRYIMEITALENVMFLSAHEAGLRNTGIGSMLIINSGGDAAIAVFAASDLPEGRGAQIVRDALEAVESSTAQIELILSPEEETQ